MTSHNGFQRSPITPAGTVVPPGSNSQHLPRRLRATWVAANTSAFMLVDTTAPGAKATDGMITDWVLPGFGWADHQRRPARTRGDHLPAGIDAEIAAGHYRHRGGRRRGRCPALRSGQSHRTGWCGWFSRRRVSGRCAAGNRGAALLAGVLLLDEITAHIGHRRQKIGGRGCHGRRGEQHPAPTGEPFAVLGFAPAHRGRGRGHDHNHRRRASLPAGPAVHAQKREERQPASGGDPPPVAATG